jgi:signal transduction histidine kinase
MAQQLILPEDELARKAGALKVISLGLAAAVLAGEIMAIVVWLIDRSFPIITATIIEAGLLFIGLLSYWLVKVNHSKFAGYFFVITFSLEAAAVTLLFGGATGPIAVLYIFPILVSGIVLGFNYSYLAATLVAALYLAMIPVEQAGIVTPVLGVPEERTIIPAFVGMWVLFFYLIAFLSWFAASRLNNALKDIRRYAAELQTANEKLQASEEELRSANEELQASEEELRSSNEELQAANEELRAAQEQLVRSEKLAAIGQLAGGVGHELRNPLGAIKNAVYYVKGKLSKSELGEKEPRVMEFLNIMDEEVNSSNKIINDLLGFSRVGKPAVSPTRIERVIEDALSHVPLPESIELVKTLNAELPEVAVDTDQIRQVMVNVLTNAVQAMPEGGKLTIGARTVDNSMQVEVTDTGVGIPEDAIGKIFDPLYTMKAKGIGLGLAVCKTIIERHQGHIEVESELGKGTAFTVKLPLIANKDSSKDSSGEDDGKD